MTRTRIEPARILVNFLRTKLTDVNSNRSGQYIFDDFPRIRDLGNNSFPRIGITILNESGESLGIYDDNQKDTVNFQIDIVAKKDQHYDVTITDEAIGTMDSTANTNRFNFEYLPNQSKSGSTSGTVSNIKHGGSAYTNVIERLTIANFTTAANVGSGTVEWAVSTGDLNFDSTDVTSQDGEAITATYTQTLEGKKLCQYLAREIIKAIKNYWRTDTTINGLINPIKINNTPIPYDEELGIFRQMLEYQFEIYNAGEGLNR